jgi:hypothetical protein
MNNKDKETIYKKYGYDKNKIPFPEMMIGKEDETVKNPYTEVEVKLNPVEVAIYDCLMGSYHAHLAAGNAGQTIVAKGLYKDFYKGKDWFIENNVEAYFKLID